MLKQRILKSKLGFKHNPDGTVEIFRVHENGSGGALDYVTIPKRNILSAYIYLGRVLRSKK